MAYINIYQGNPTAGGTDGTVVSSDGSFTAPISFSLDASQSESKVVTCAIRTETGYRATDVTIQPTKTSSPFTLCKTANGTYTTTLTFAEVTAVNSVFYVKASSTSSDLPTSTRSIKLQYNGDIWRATS